MIPTYKVIVYTYDTPDEKYKELIKYLDENEDGKQNDSQLVQNLNG